MSWFDDLVLCWHCGEVEREEYCELCRACYEYKRRHGGKLPPDSVLSKRYGWDALYEKVKQK